MRRRLLDLLRDRRSDLTKDEIYARIMCGEVVVNGETVRNPRAQVSMDSDITFVVEHHVSRGGIKLESALDAHGIDPRGLVALDAGASTGGFTQCLLDRGARFVHAVDVGWNQLDFSLRRRPEVGVHERCNIMDMSAFEPDVDFAVADLSFRSLRGAARHIISLTSRRTLLALVKPQFEWVRPPDSFDGVVRSTSDLRLILSTLIGALRREGVSTDGVSESPIRGRRGNREFFFLLRSASPGDLETVEATKAAALRRIDDLLANGLRVYDSDSRVNGSPTKGLSGPR